MTKPREAGSGVPGTLETEISPASPPVRHFRSLMSPAWRMVYLATLLSPAARIIRVRLRSGLRMRLRKDTTDRFVAREMFAMEVYRPPREFASGSVRRIVDVGANIGCSILYFAGLFPEARFEAFEPHPDNLDALAYHLAVNRLLGRVRVHPVAAGTREASVYLRGSGGGSTVVAAPEPGTIPVRVADFFTTVEPGRIDLLKMDCEGGEWDIVMDPRFATLDIGAIVMEWHATFENRRTKHEMVARLESLGWRLHEVDEGHEYEEEIVGILWAVR